MRVQENILLAPYTIYKIGGPARYFIECASQEDVESAVEFAAEKNLPFFILGAGSNMLVADAGFEGAAIRVSGGVVRAEGERLIADAGVMMARAVSVAAAARLAGFEWGIGVPGTIGGSVRGNAGCFGGEMRDVIETVAVLDARSGARRVVQATECVFGYRDSFFKKNPHIIILSVILGLTRADPADIQKRIREVTAMRAARQDIGSKCAGCIFRNAAWPEEERACAHLVERFPDLAEFEASPHIPASYLIDHAGLKGRRAGQAVISAKHANYFINEGGGRAADIRALIDMAKTEVKEKYGICLEEEIQYIGFR